MEIPGLSCGGSACRCSAEHIAQCILPDIISFYESEEGQREFQEWKAQREAEAAERKAGRTERT